MAAALPIWAVLAQIFAPIALELGKDVWNGLSMVQNGTYPSYDLLIQLNDETQAKIDSQKPSGS